jgi:hypothetical protein
LGVTVYEGPKILVAVGVHKNPMAIALARPVLAYKFRRIFINHDSFTRFFAVEPAAYIFFAVGLEVLAHTVSFIIFEPSIIHRTFFSIVLSLPILFARLKFPRIPIPISKDLLPTAMAEVIFPPPRILTAVTPKKLPLARFLPFRPLAEILAAIV